jgi:DNA polymerase III delta subunit
MSATLTLPLDAELQGWLAKKAAEAGVQVETFAVDALKRVVQMSIISEITELKLSTLRITAQGFAAVSFDSM